MRHSGATRVRIKLQVRSGVLRVAIHDNGRGITPKQKTDVKSLGIVGMKERIVRLGGEFNIFSEQGTGTLLDISIPVNHD